MKKQKKILLLAVIATALTIGIVYAALTALTLKVNTSATASATIFSVGFDDVAPRIVKPNSVTVNAATPVKGSREITLSIDGLKAVGDKVEAYYTIINDGEVDASDVQVQIGPGISGDGDWPEDFRPLGSTWTSEDGVFKFAAYKHSAGSQYWSIDSDGTTLLPVGTQGSIEIEVQLLKRVDTDTQGSCTVKLVAIPGDISN